MVWRLWLQADLEVVGVVGRGHLDAAGAEVHLARTRRPTMGISRSISGRMQVLPTRCLVALVVGVDGHAGIAHHGLGPGGGDHQIPAGAVGRADSAACHRWPGLSEYSTSASERAVRQWGHQLMMRLPL